MTAPQRIKTAPDVPATDEAGLPGYYCSFWHALWAPKDTPKPIIAKLNDALRKALADPATHKRLVDLSQDIFPPDRAVAGSAAKIPANGNRQLVADHQGSRHQSAMKSAVSTIARIRDRHQAGCDEGLRRLSRRLTPPRHISSGSIAANQFGPRAARCPLLVR